MPADEITPGLMAANFALQVETRAPADVWNALSIEARHLWLREAFCGRGYATLEWYQLEAQVQRELRFAIRRIMAFVGQAGLDLLQR